MFEQLPTGVRQTFGEYAALAARERAQRVVEVYVRSAALQQIFQMFAQRFVVVATLARCFLCCFFHWPFSDIHQRAVRIRLEFQTCDFSFPGAVPPLYANSPQTYRATLALTLPRARLRWHTFAYPASAVRNSKGALMQRDY